MSCRALKSSEAAVRALSSSRVPTALWITDDLLHAAFRRFAHFTCKRINSRVHTGLGSRESLTRTRVSGLTISCRRNFPSNVATLEVHRSHEEVQWDSSLPPEEPYEPVEITLDDREKDLEDVDEQPVNATDVPLDFLDELLSDFNVRTPKDKPPDQKDSTISETVSQSPPTNNLQHREPLIRVARKVLHNLNEANSLEIPPTYTESSNGASTDVDIDPSRDFKTQPPILSFEDHLQTLRTIQDVSNLKPDSPAQLHDKVSIESVLSQLCSHGASASEIFKLLHEPTLFSEQSVLHWLLGYIRRNQNEKSRLPDLFDALARVLVTSQPSTVDTSALLGDLTATARFLGSPEADQHFLNLAKNIISAFKDTPLTSKRQILMPFIAQAQQLGNCEQAADILLALYQECWPLPDSAPHSKQILHWTKLAKDDSSKAHTSEISETGFSKGYLADIMSTLFRAKRFEIFRDATEIASRTPVGQDSNNGKELADMRTWIAALQGCEVLSKGLVSDFMEPQFEGDIVSYRVTKTWSFVYRYLARSGRLVFFDQYLPKEYRLSNLTSRQVCRLVLEFFSHRYFQMEVRSSRLERQLKRSKWLFEKAPLLARDQNNHTEIAEFANLIHACVRTSLPCQILLSEVFGFLSHTRGLEAVVHLSTLLLRYSHGETLMPMVIRSLYSTAQPRKTDEGEENASLESSVIGAVLQLFDAFPYLGRVLTRLSTTDMIPSTLYSSIVANSAQRIAFAPNVRHTRAFRRVEWQYRTMSRKRLPISLVRALTYTAIIRPLMEGTRVSTMRCMWVLGLIRKYEGQKAADELDKLVYGWRKEVEHLKQSGEMRAGPPFFGITYYDPEAYLSLLRPEHLVNKP